MTAAPVVAGVTIEFPNLASLLLAIVFVVVLGLVAGRLAGIAVGRLRAAATAVIGTIVGLAGATAAVPERSETDVVFALTVVFGVMATMLLMIVPEAIGRPRRVRVATGRRRHALLHPVRWLRSLLAPLARARQVLRSARRHGLARPHFLTSAGISTPEFGYRLRLTLEGCGGMFVKFGQIASTRSDLLSDPVIEELSHLRAEVRPVPAGHVRPLVEAELGRPVEEVFTSFEAEPLASASIGQVHRAVLCSGEPVVVKIQRPGLEDLLGRDATVLRLAARTVERRVPAAAGFGLRGLADEIITSMERELDFLREAMMADRLRLAVAHDDPADDVVRIPLVHLELSTDRLLVMEEAAGRPIDAPGAVADSGVPPHMLASALLSSFLQQMFRGGVFHADPHPGNIMVDEWGRLWLLDFGAVGMLDATTRRALQDMTIGMGTDEPILVARAVRRLAGADATADLRALESDIGALMVETSGGFDPALIQQVLVVMSRHGLRIPTTLLALSRALLTLDGTLRVIDPQFVLATELPVTAEALRPPEEEMIGDLLQQELRRSLPVLRMLPEHLDELATQLRAGQLGVRVERFAGRDEQVVGRWVDRLLLGLFGCAGLVASGVILVAAQLARSHDVRLSLQAVGYIGLVLGSVLVMRSVAQALRRERQHAD